jgi:hypothetical protein
MCYLRVFHHHGIILYFEHFLEIFDAHVSALHQGQAGTTF